MKRRTGFGKLGVLALVLVLALVAGGVAYATWSQELVITETVTTGEVDWKFNAFHILDTTHGTATPDYHCNNGFAGWTFWPDPDGKDIAWGEGELVDGPDNDGDMSQLNLTFRNVYPSYFNSVSVYPVNNGTVPIVFEKLVIGTTEITGTPTPVVPLDLNGDGLDDVEIYWGNGIGQQLDPGDPPLEMSFWFHCLQEAPQGESLEFTITLVGVQWNMAP